MGICLDTDQQDRSKGFEESGAQNTEKWRRQVGILATPPGGSFPTQNAGPVRFEPPSVPVIFVLGGPGSGKVTHCDNFTQEKKGLVHINMTDLLQQYALGNDMKDFGLLSSKTVTEVLMLEMKMSLGAKTFLVSGYPRNMRDVVEYSEKIQIVNGVILVAWEQEVLQRQIDYGAQLGQVIIELARIELENFYKNVIPVAEYFDQSEMLLVVNGQRIPSEVYVDFRQSVLRILGLADETVSPKRHVSSSIEAEVSVERGQDEYKENIARKNAKIMAAPNSLSSTRVEDEIAPTKSADLQKKMPPPIVWVLGGPGSNKAMVCSEAVRKMTNWIHLSISSHLITMSTGDAKIRESLKSGELVSSDIVIKLVEQQIRDNRKSSGIVIDGFPRDLKQAREFQNKFRVKPHMLLLDVSRLQPERGRPYDETEAFARRLELFGELALPLLKSLDAEGRLSIVDGETELPADRQQFASALLELMRRAARNEDEPNRISVIETTDDATHAATWKTPNGMAKVIDSEPTDGGMQLLKNGILPGYRQRPKQSETRQLLQNGISSRMVNGFLGTNNRIAPAFFVDPLRRTYNAAQSARDAPPTNLHI
ncbi:PREDICTED: adenylate kinase isoenzyme 5 [Ceratosolen solmsi marchali]|uniref:Adenylate kinase isoenzyme 5 n=1 Tax=Ceratosolen solmsi marchali TaxID=326594 RepID=A0AAJ6YSH0_9HYME|nr:PREDICTED: adenylate kinase isoenzyme 5 [Ceratosolen solmsi marchali]